MDTNDEDSSMGERIRRMTAPEPPDLEEFRNLKEITEIPALPFIGNAFDVAGPLDTNRSMCILGRELCAKYGTIFRLSLMGHDYVVISDPDLVQTVFESPEFGKITETDAIFKELRSFRLVKIFILLFNLL